jgi:integrase
LPELRAELDMWKADRQTMTILEHRGKPWIPAYLSTWLPDQLERIGLPRQLGLHGLRRLTAIRLAEAGCSTHEIAAITGHRTLQMVQEYTRGVRQRTLADVATLRLAKQNRPKKLQKIPNTPTKSTE